MTTKIYSTTMALCPQCYKKVTARIIARENQVFIRKFCPEHGFSEALISSDEDWYAASRSYIKPRQLPVSFNVNDFKGCPESCGFCTEHQQHTCLPVLEINSGCDLDCPVCLKEFNSEYSYSMKDFESVLETLLSSEEKVDIINLSGGEPTLHPLFKDFIRKAREKKITQITVSTNGLSLLKDKTLRDFFREEGVIAALQFDGFKPESYIALRGADLSREKLQLIELFEAENILFSLVCTVANGINAGEITTIADFFFKSSALSIMFQPIALTGSAVKNFNPETSRLTIPDVVKELEKSGSVKPGDFNPLPCSHYSCFALSYYLKTENQQFVSLKEFLGKESYLEVIANKTLPGLDRDGYARFKDRIYELWSCADSCSYSGSVLKRIKQIYLEMNESGFNARKALDIGVKHMKAVFIHDFMDVHSFDFGRVMKCSNPYALPGKLIPMCAANVCR